MCISMITSCSWALEIVEGCNLPSRAHLKLWLFLIFLAICGFHPKITAPAWQLYASLGLSKCFWNNLSSGFSSMVLCLFRILEQCRVHDIYYLIFRMFWLPIWRSFAVIKFLAAINFISDNLNMWPATRK